MPLTAELTRLLLRERFSYSDMREWAKALQKRIARLGKISAAEINVEKFFDFARFDAQTFRLRQQVWPHGHQGSPEESAEDIEYWLTTLEINLVNVIWSKQQRARSSQIVKWCKHLRDDDHIISFNYDTLVENALRKLKRSWHHGMSNTKCDGICISKMHGSVDWLMVEPVSTDQKVRQYELLFQMPNDSRHADADGVTLYDELRRVNDLEDLQSEVNRLHSRPAQGIRFALAGLGSEKPLHRVPGLILTWHNACNVLSDADEVFVIGFSLSPFDTMARLLFSDAMWSRKERPVNVNLVDPNAHKLRPRFEAVFGQVQAFKAPWESLDWGTFPKRSAKHKKSVV